MKSMKNREEDKRRLQVSELLLHDLRQLAEMTDASCFKNPPSLSRRVLHVLRGETLVNTSPLDKLSGFTRAARTR